jgi:hypothetical protein
MSRLLRSSLAAAFAAGALAFTPVGALADSASHTFLLVAEHPNIGVAANGESIAITCEVGEHVCGTFSVKPKSIEASGEFAHFLADGSLFASGTWTATQLISFHAYGCGVLFGEPIPPDFCGGVVKFRASFSTPIGELPGVITVFCVVGDKVPSNIGGPFTEGVTVVVPGIVNFNHPAGGENIYVQLS